MAFTCRLCGGNVTLLNGTLKCSNPNCKFEMTKLVIKEDIIEKVCSSCGFKNPPNAVICLSCGIYLKI